jgi:hypothetical protein
LTNVTPLTNGDYYVVVTNLYGTITSSNCLLTVNEKPLVQSQPTNTVVEETSNAVFRVTASGTDPLAYQWHFNGSNVLAGATNATLTISNVSLSNVGNYSVVVSNAFGNVTSTNASLSVLTWPSITVQPLTNITVLLVGNPSTNTAATNYSSTNVVLTVTAAGTPNLEYQWWYTDNSTTTNTIGTTSTNSSLTLTNVTPLTNGDYYVVVTNLYGTITSSNCLLTVNEKPLVQSQPTNTVVEETSNAVFHVTASGTDPLAYQWHFNGSNVLAGATNATLTISNVSLSNVGNYSVVVSNAFGNVTSTNASLSVLTWPSITVQPLTNITVLLVGNPSTNAATTNYSSTNVVLTVTAAGTPNLEYQWWYTDNSTTTNTIGTTSTNSSLTLTNVTPLTNGDYYVVVTNLYGTITSSNCLLTVNEKPLVQSQPTNTVVEETSNAVFRVTASGTDPLAYQWHFNGSNVLAGATNATLTVSNVSLSNVGNYSVVVSNAFGNVTSTNASLSVLTWPSITVQPLTNITVLLVGNPSTNAATTNYSSTNVVLTVTAAGTPNLEYQWWYTDNSTTTNTIGTTTTNSSLTLTNVTPLTNGDYYVVVTNLYGTITSSNCLLTVNEKPLVQSQPTNTVVEETSNAVFRVTASGTDPLAYQWHFNGSNVLAGATNATLTVSNVSLSNVGNYSVVVSNAFGNVTSTNASLSVLTWPSITVQPLTNITVLLVGNPATNAATTNYNSTNVVLTVTAAGTPNLEYQWWYTDNSTTTNTIGTTSTNSSLTLTNVTPLTNGDYYVVVTNLYGTITSSNCLLTVNEKPLVQSQPTNTVVEETSNAVFRVTASGTDPLAYQWHFNGSNVLAGATNATLTVSNVSLSNVGNYSVVVSNAFGNVTSTNASLSVLTWPSITVQPLTNITVLLMGNPATNAATTNYNSTNVVLTVTAAGTPNLEYQWWYTDNSTTTNTIGTTSTNSSLTLTNVTPLTNGDYYVVVTNLYGTITSSNCLLTVNEKPLVQSQPTNTAELETSNAVFTVTASGTAPLTYQWLFNRTNTLAGDTNATLTLTNLQVSESGSYSVVVSNAFGTVTSTNAILNVLAWPAITVQPLTNVTIDLVSTATNYLATNVVLTAVATGTPTLEYQWWFTDNSTTTNMVGLTTTNASLTLTNIAEPTNAIYFVVVTNLYGSVTSSNCVLTVDAPPTF